MPPMIADLQTRLRTAWSWRTATTWTSDNPARGQCGVTALVAQDLPGGTILKTRLAAGWHFYNEIDGQRHDFTASQFDAPVPYDDLMSNRDEAFTDTTPEQYRALRAALGLP